MKTYTKAFCSYAGVGCIGLATSAPPCKEYSRLKMQPGGPPPLRTPAYMDGLPHLNTAQKEKVRQSREIHRRGRQPLLAVMSKGGIGILEQLPSSLAWLEPENHNLFREFQGHIAWTDACRYGIRTGQKAGHSHPTTIWWPAYQPCATIT